MSVVTLTDKSTFLYGNKKNISPSPQSMKSSKYLMVWFLNISLLQALFISNCVHIKLSRAVARGWTLILSSAVLSSVKIYRET